MCIFLEVDTDLKSISDDKFGINVEFSLDGLTWVKCL